MGGCVTRTYNYPARQVVARLGTRAITQRRIQRQRGLWRERKSGCIHLRLNRPSWMSPRHCRCTPTWTRTSSRIRSQRSLFLLRRVSGCQESDSLDWSTTRDPLYPLPLHFLPLNILHHLDMPSRLWNFRSWSSIGWA